MDNEIIYKPIGVVNSPFKEPKGMPVQPAAATGIEGTIKLYPEYVDGLKDLNGFSHIVLLCHMHLAREPELLVKPFMDNELRGVFAVRAPSRPNSIGLSVVRLDKIEGNTLFIRDVDLVDGTPLLDIKPYVPEFDHPEALRIGWLEKNIRKLRKTQADDRFAK